MIQAPRARPGPTSSVWCATRRSRTLMAPSRLRTARRLTPLGGHVSFFMPRAASLYSGRDLTPRWSQSQRRSTRRPHVEPRQYAAADIIVWRLTTTPSPTGGGATCPCVPRSATTVGHAFNQIHQGSRAQQRQLHHDPDARRRATILGTAGSSPTRSSSAFNEWVKRRLRLTNHPTAPARSTTSARHRGRQGSTTSSG